MINLSECFFLASLGTLMLIHADGWLGVLTAGGKALGLHNPRDFYNYFMVPGDFDSSPWLIIIIILWYQEILIALLG